MRTLICIFVIAANLTAATYYIAAGGSDTNNGTTKSTPWAHLPGMPTCTSVCASTTPLAGDMFIFRGGDTWHYSDMGIAWSWNGTSGSPIYIGVDQTWYSGVSWSRPIFTCDGQACASNPGGAHTQIQVWGTYVTLDNIEFTGLYLTAAMGYDISSVQLAQQGDEVKNCYFHGWIRDANPGGGDVLPVTTYIGGGTGQILGTSVHNNVIDGYDSFLAGVRTGAGIINGASIYNNVVRYVFNGINGDWDTLYGNLVEHVDFWASSGAHCNGIYHKQHVDDTAKTLRMYNNVLRDSSASGCVAWYVMGNDICSACNLYFYNNVVYNFPNAGDPLISFPGDSGTAGGTGYFYNNTIQSPTAHCFGNGLSTVTGALHYANTHCINSNGASGAVCVTGGSGLTCTDDASGHSILQTLAAANSDGYSAAGYYAPTTGSGGTVGAATNETSQVSAFGSAYGSSASFAVGYDAVNHVVTYPGRTPLTRPSSAAWDIGAYQYTPPPQGVTRGGPVTFGGPVRIN